MRTQAIAAGIGALVLTPLLAPAAAGAADDQRRLGVSRNRVGYHQSLTTPLFDEHRRWIPGEVRSATFFVRNRSAEPGDLTIQLATSIDDDFDDYFTVSVLGRGQTWHRIEGLSPLPVGGSSLRPGHHARLRVRAELAWDAPSSTMLSSSDLDFHLTLTDARARANRDFVPTAATQSRAPLSDPVQRGVVLLGLAGLFTAMLTRRLRLSRRSAGR